MKRILLLFASKEGQTEKIAIKIASHLQALGASVQLLDASHALAAETVDISSFDLLVFGTSMHVGGLGGALVEFINQHRKQVERKARSFFLVLLSAATKDPALKSRTLADARTKLDQQLLVSFDHVEMIAGALMYSKYSLPMKWVMKRIARKSGEDINTSMDYEYTDWSQVQRYAEDIAKL